MPSQRKSKRKVVDFSADRPISSAKADRFGRGVFAASLAQQIQSWNGRDSLVIALCGEWGCGKTSLKNMVLEKLCSTAKPKVDLLEFNPWEISGQDALMANFFRELAVPLSPIIGTQTSNTGTIRRLRLYAKLASFGGTALKAIGTALGADGNVLATVASAAGEAATQTADVANRGAEAQEAINESNLSLSELKRSLTRDMAALKKPVLIVIDDIDRLTTDEIREIFKVVKANADFPNLIYLLMFDREIVGAALDSISGGRGHEFLDKIVQVLFHVPQPSLKCVHNVLFDGLNAHLAISGIGERWENSRWGNVWPGGLSVYFKNLRSVYRFLSSFSFTVAQMQNGSTFELNPLDLVVLETLRLFEPSLYESLPANRELLIGKKHSRYLDDGERKKRFAAGFNILLSVSSEVRREYLKDILVELFPAISGTKDVDQDILLRDLRVGHDFLFDRYFTLALSSGDIAQADLDSLRANFANPDEFNRICTTLKKQGKLETAFERLDVYRQQLPKSAFPQLITSIVNAGDLLDEKDDRKFFSLDSLSYAWRLIYFGLRSFEEESARLEHLKNGLSDAVGVRLMVKIVSNEERRPNSSSSEHLLSEEQWEELKMIALERIRHASRVGTLKKLKGLSYLLWRWHEWGSEHEVKDWIMSHVTTTNDALWVLRTFVSTSRRESNKVTFVRYHNLETLARFADIEPLLKITQPLEIEKLSQEDKRALRAFRQALIWKTEGKSPDYHGDDWRGDNPLAEDS